MSKHEEKSPAKPEAEKENTGTGAAQKPEGNPENKGADNNSEEKDNSEAA